MNLQECKKDYAVYKLVRSGEKRIEQGKVVEISMPHLDHSQPGTMQMVVDATLDFGGKVRTYVMPEKSSIIYTPDGEVISADIKTVLQEVEADKARSEEAIKMHDSHVENVKQCEAILEQWNPALKEKRETDRRISTLEGLMNEMLQLMKKNTGTN